MTPEQRQEIIRLLEQGEEISPEWARILFPPEKREYELVYYGKEREEVFSPTRWLCRFNQSAPLEAMVAMGKANGRTCSSLVTTFR